MVYTEVTKKEAKSSKAVNHRSQAVILEVTAYHQT